MVPQLFPFHALYILALPVDKCRYLNCSRCSKTQMCNRGLFFIGLCQCGERYRMFSRLGLWLQSCVCTLVLHNIPGSGVPALYPLLQSRGLGFITKLTHSSAAAWSILVFTSVSPKVFLREEVEKQTSQQLVVVRSYSCRGWVKVWISSNESTIIDSYCSLNYKLKPDVGIKIFN